MDIDFPHLPHPLACLRIGDEMNMRQLGDGMTEALVESTFGDVAATDMRDRHPCHSGSDGAAQDFITVPQHQQQVRFQSHQRVGHAVHHPAAGMSQAGGVVACQPHVNFGTDLEPIEPRSRRRVTGILHQMLSG